MPENNEERRIVFTTELVESLTQKLNSGYILHRYENPWFQKEIGIRTAGLTFRMTPTELLEYAKCKADIHYFADNYCRIKLENGQYGQMKLRPYQKDILTLFQGSRSCLSSSRQSGKCLDLLTVGHFLDKVKNKYVTLPFFQILFEANTEKTFYDYIKYFLYLTIFKIKEFAPKETKFNI